MIAKLRRGMLDFATIAQAYIDPGSGAILWQVLAAAFVGVLFVLRKLNPIRRMRDWFRRARLQK